MLCCNGSRGRSYSWKCVLTLERGMHTGSVLRTYSNRGMCRFGFGMCTPSVGARLQKLESLARRTCALRPSSGKRWRVRAGGGVSLISPTNSYFCQVILTLIHSFTKPQEDTLTPIVLTLVHSFTKPQVDT